MSFIVRFTPYRGTATADTQTAFIGDWQMHEGTKMDAPRWVPSGGARSESAGTVAQQEAFVDTGHTMRTGELFK